MAASSRQREDEGVDVIGRNGPRRKKSTGRNRNTVANKESKKENFWGRFDRLVGNEVRGMRVSLGNGREWDIQRASDRERSKKVTETAKAGEELSNRDNEELGGLKKGGDQERPQPTPAAPRRQRTSEPVIPTAPTTPQLIQAPAASPGDRMAELAQMAIQNNKATSNRAAARGEYPPALSAVPERFQDDVMRASKKTGVQPGVLAAVMQTESGFDPKATSSAGAMGLMQSMPFWSDSSDDPMGKFDPRKNPKRAIMLGAKILEGYISDQGGLKKGLMAYNAGPGNMPAGRDYAVKVLETLRQLRRR